MEKIDLILDGIIGNSEIKIVKLVEQRIVSNGMFYEIDIRLIKKSEVCIYYKWNVGIIGKIIFKSILEEKNTIYDEIKNKLTASGFILNEINLRT